MHIVKMVLSFRIIFSVHPYSFPLDFGGARCKSTLVNEQPANAKSDALRQTPKLHAQNTDELHANHIFESVQVNLIDARFSLG